MNEFHLLTLHCMKWTRREKINPPMAASIDIMIAYAYSLDPDQARLYVGPDLDPNC